MTATGNRKLVTDNHRLRSPFLTSHFSLLTSALALGFACAIPAAAQSSRFERIQTGPQSRPADGADALPNNYFGVHLLIDNVTGRNAQQLRWARHLVGRWGYAKTLFMNIDRNTRGADKGWIDYVEMCYKLELIPVIRLAGRMDKGAWVKPQADATGDYGSMANAIRRVVDDLPRSDKCPLYIEIWNEPNLPDEWSGRPSPEEYAAFFVQAAKAIRSLHDNRIKILNAGLALSPAYVEKLCQAQPDFIRSFDLWACHPYPGNRPPWINHHDKTAPAGSPQTFDAYLLELAVLAKFGLANPRVMITETGSDLGNGYHSRDEGLPIIDEYIRADYMVRAFRDYYPQWREVVAVMPFEFCNANWSRFDWVYPDSGTKSDGAPDHAHYQYTAVAALAKPTDTTGAVNGTLRAAGVDVRLDGVTVTVPRTTDQHSISDPMGNFFLPKMAPGTYQLEFRKAGFKNIDRSVLVKAATNTVVNLDLEAEHRETLTGTIRGEDDRSLNDVKVTLQPGNLATKTNGNGEYTFHDLIPTRYRLTAEANGRYVYDSNDVEIAINKSNRRDFRLGKLANNLPGDNLLANPSFEAGGNGAGLPGLALGYEPGNDAGRNSEASLINERTAHTGRCAQELKARATETIVRQISNYNTAQPGERYVAGVWIRADIGDGGAWMTFDFTDNAGKILRRLDPKKQIKGHNRNWTWLSTDGLAPAGTERVAINLHTQGRGGRAYFDDAYVGKAVEKK